VFAFFGGIFWWRGKDFWDIERAQYLFEHFDELKYWKGIIKRFDKADEEKRETDMVREETTVAKKALSEGVDTPLQTPAKTVEPAPEKEIVSPDPSIVAKEQLEKIAEQKKATSEQIRILEDQLLGAKGIVNKFTQEKSAVDLQLTPIKDQEDVVEESIAEIEHREATAGLEERRSLEEHRWQLEAERKKLESRRWEIDKKMEEIEVSIRRAEITRTEISDKKEAGLKELADLERQEERIKLKLELEKVSKRKTVLELEWVKLKNQYKEQESIMNTTLSEEKNIEEQKNGIEEKERTAQSSKEERTFEQKRQGLEEKRQGLEEKRWTLEKGLGQTKELIEKLKPDYQEALNEEERLKIALVSLDNK